MLNAKKISSFLLILSIIFSVSIARADIFGSTQAAEDIEIDDSGDYYTGEDVETALQEIGSGTTLDNRYLKLDQTTPQTVTGTIGADDFKVYDFSLGTPTYSTLNDFMKLAMSSGRISGGTITDAGSQQVNVAAGTGWIKATDSDTADLMFFDWSALNGNAIPTNTVRYIGVKYNNGTPVVTVETDNTWDLDTEFPLGSVINQSDDLYILNNSWWVSDGLTNVIERFQADGYTVRDNYVGGLIIGTSSTNTTRKPTLTAGTIWSRLNEFDITSKDCSAGNTFYGFYRDGGTNWTRTAAKTDIDDYYDDDSGTLHALDNNKYVNFWVFVEADTVNSGQLMVIYPQTQYNTAAEAENGTIPVFPTSWYEHGLLVGRIIIKQGVTAPIAVQTAFENNFGYALAANHNNLSSLQGGAVNEYYHLDATEFGYLDGQNQSVKTTSDVTHNDIVATSRLKLPTDATAEAAGDIRYSSTAVEPQYYDGSTWHYMGSPKYLYIKATTQSEGNLNLLDATNWNTDKSQILFIKVETSSTSWDLDLYPDDDFDEAGTFPSMKLVNDRDGDYTVYMNMPYYDTDASKEVHLKYTDNDAANTADIYIWGVQLK